MSSPPSADTKRCPTCTRVVSVALFSRNRSTPDGLQSVCKECHIVMVRSAEAEPGHRVRYNTAVKRRRDDRAVAIWEYLLQHPCVDCGEADPVVLEFDHVRGKKVAPVSVLISKASWDRIWAEVAKCDVRCANCHRRKTALERGWHRHTKEITA